VFFSASELAIDLRPLETMLVKTDAAKLVRHYTMSDYNVCPSCVKLNISSMLPQNKTLKQSYDISTVIQWV